jgi:two-component system cell cycle sensor histidine kinase/response regulator CckA
MPVPSAATTVLFVDDNEQSRQSLSWFLKEEGFKVTEAGTGGEAIELARERPDVVVLDVSLPDISGFEVCRRIKAHPATASIPVLHLSGVHVSAKDKTQGLDQGADAYMTKPVEPAELVAQVKALVRLHRAEEEAREAAQHWRATFDAIHDGICLLNLRGEVLRCNHAFAQILARPSEEILGRALGDLLSGLASEESSFHSGRALRGEKELSLGGRWFRLRTDPLQTPKGSPAGTVVILSDITERRRLEEQFLQSQKMEAIGRLAGGVAHDFNNLLTVIIGHSEMTLSRPTAPELVAESIQEIKRAAERAASLTRQLLAFSRKQVLALLPLDLNPVVSRLIDLLRRLIGEDIQLTTNLDPGLGLVKADQGQIEQVLMNLAVNARDAMPEGGKLTIETKNVVVEKGLLGPDADAGPGPYVLLAVSDTGCGMTEQVKSRIFEPFFTTKGPGKGTGLGLATVYGIVKQSGGHVAVYSEPGRGTAFKVYLPRVEMAVPLYETRPSVADFPLGKETILLVEDEEALRRLSQQILELAGYTVLVAQDGEEAVQMVTQYAGVIDLLLTDVVMPRMSGPQAVEQLDRLRPGLKVLYLSGYTDNAVVQHGVLEQDAAFLQKPFTPRALARKVREVLDWPSDQRETGA